MHQAECQRGEVWAGGCRENRAFMLGLGGATWMAVVVRAFLLAMLPGQREKVC